ncbi:MAG: homoserine dehydrogenase [Bacteroidales bacterium]|nr:homoserine dehydrogenase [Lentimicrobiaceae bacterium]MDD5696191.1 homoserine dehydrogenase [Bacteroidales bacterium]
MKQRIVIIGFGTVGQGFCEILLNKKEYLKKQYGFKWEIVGIADQVYGNVYNAKGLDVPSLLEEAKAKKPFSRDVTPWDTLSLIKKSKADIVCELTFTDLKTGEPAFTHCKEALKSGKHVVTSNKGPAALHYRKLIKLADKNGLHFRIEGTVVAGTPILNLAAGPLAGCAIAKIRGILNGTTNYMLTEMEKGMTYEKVLKIAQELGYAEADPTGDVEGHDARGKVTILANVVMDGNLAIDDVPCSGITGITPADIRTAKENGKRWKLIGTVEMKDGKVTGSVAPEMIDLTHPLAGVMGATNALTFTTDLLGDVTMIGPGAGRWQTGFAILNDVLTIDSAY